VTNKHYNKAIAVYAENLNNAAKRVLGRRTIGKNKTYGEASGALRKSLKYVLKQGAKTEVTFGSPLNYAKFVYYGVNGTGRNNQSPFKFKKQPPMDAIKKWMRVKPVRMRSASGAFVSQKPYTSKRTGKTIDPLDKAAFVIARSIKKKGIKGIKYYEIAFEETYKKEQQKLMDAMQMDLLEDLESKVPERPSFKFEP